MKKDQTTLIMVIVAIIVAIYLFKDKLGTFFSGEGNGTVIDGSGGGGGSIPPLPITPPPSDTQPPPFTPPPYEPPPGGMEPINKNPYHDVWLSRPISKRFPWIAPSFYEASGRAYGIEQNIKGGIANKVLAMMSTTNKNVKLMPDYTFHVTIPAKTNISSFKAVSVVPGGVANKIKAMTGSKVPALIKKLNKPPSGFIKSDKDLYHQAVLTPTTGVKGAVFGISQVVAKVVQPISLGTKITTPTVTPTKTTLTPQQIFLKFGK